MPPTQPLASTIASAVTLEPRCDAEEIVAGDDGVLLFGDRHRPPAARRTTTAVVFGGGERGGRRCWREVDRQVLLAVGTHHFALPNSAKPMRTGTHHLDRCMNASSGHRVIEVGYALSVRMGDGSWVSPINHAPGTGRTPIFGDRPDDEALTAAHVAGHEHSRHVRHVAIVASHVAACRRTHRSCSSHELFSGPTKPIARKTKFMGIS